MVDTQGRSQVSSTNDAPMDTGPAFGRFVYYAVLLAGGMANTA